METSPSLPVFMDETRVEKSILNHFQQRNANMKIFGGYVMRLAYETAYMSAYLHGSDAIPQFFMLDDITFTSAVEIGTVSKFVATVTYVEPPFVHVEIDVFTVEQKQ